MVTYPTSPWRLYRFQSLWEYTAETLLLSMMRAVFHHVHVSKHVIRGENGRSNTRRELPSTAASVGSMTKKKPSSLISRHCMLMFTHWPSWEGATRTFKHSLNDNSLVCHVNKCDNRKVGLRTDFRFSCNDFFWLKAWNAFLWNVIIYLYLKWLTE